MAWQFPIMEDSRAVFIYKLLINNIRSMEVNPFIRKLIPFFYREVFTPARKW